MKKTRVYKAQPIGDQAAQDTTITVCDEIPYTAGENMADVRARFVADATVLESALYNALPGGTYSELLRAMLERRASHFVVPFGHGDD